MTWNHVASYNFCQPLNDFVINIYHLQQKHHIGSQFATNMCFVILKMLYSANFLVVFLSLTGL
jgi:hypothetical protein